MTVFYGIAVDSSEIALYDHTHQELYHRGAKLMVTVPTLFEAVALLRHFYGTHDETVREWLDRVTIAPDVVDVSAYDARMEYAIERHQRSLKVGEGHPANVDIDIDDIPF